MEAGSSQLPTAKPSRGTLVPGQEPPRFRLRGCHPLRRAIPGHFGYRGSAPWGSRPQPRDPSTPHLPTVIPWGIGLGSPPFGRPYSGDPVLVSFPPPTKMFPFGGFPSGTPVPHEEERFPGRRGLFAPGGRSHSAIPGSTAACAYPGLIAACHGLPRRPSRAIHRAASVPQARGRGAEPRIRPVPPGAPVKGSWMSPSRAYLSMALTTAPTRDKHEIHSYLPGGAVHALRTGPAPDPVLHRIGGARQARERQALSPFPESLVGDPSPYRRGASKPPRGGPKGDTPPPRPGGLGPCPHGGR